MKKVLIIGAKSDIAKAVAVEYAKSKHDLYLFGRKIEELSDFAEDIKIRYTVNVTLTEFDLLDYSSHKSIWEGLEEKPEISVCAAGYLGDNQAAGYDFDEACKIMNSNYIGCVSILNIIAAYYESVKKGSIVGISSVAGDRGRASNYIYGSAKAAFTAYLSGLRNRLSKCNVNVLTVKPGFVRTKMTEGLKLPKKLTAEPYEAAKDIFIAEQNGKDTIYTKWFWKYIMLIIQHIPEKIFKKLSL